MYRIDYWVITFGVLNCLQMAGLETRRLFSCVWSRWGSQNGVMYPLPPRSWYRSGQKSLFTAKTFGLRAMCGGRVPNRLGETRRGKVCNRLYVFLFIRFNIMFYNFKTQVLSRYINNLESLIYLIACFFGLWDESGASWIWRYHGYHKNS